jgi:hypothetical protein
MYYQFPEPSLRDALKDPVVQAVMAADGVDPAALSALMRETARKIELGARASPAWRCVKERTLAANSPCG